MAKRKRSRSQKDLDTVTARANVRFGGEESTIKGLVRGALSDYGSDLTSAEAGAKSGVHFAKKARKPTKAIYKKASSEVAATTADVNTAFGKLGAAADPFRAATERERAGYATGIAAERANALNELTSRALEARAGGQYARRKAKEDYNKTVSDLSQRLLDLQGRKGSFATSELGSITEARAGRKATSRNIQTKIDAEKDAADVKFGHDKTLVKLKNKGKGPGKESKGLPKGVKHKSQDKIDAFQSDLDQAITFAKRYTSKDAAKADLTTGRTPAKDPTTGQSSEGIPRIKDSLVLSLALEQVFGGSHISPASAKRLHKRGFRVSDLSGIISATEGRRRQDLAHLRAGAG